jgi:hypothetical protein
MMNCLSLLLSEIMTDYLSPLFSAMYSYDWLSKLTVDNNSWYSTNEPFTPIQDISLSYCGCIYHSVGCLLLMLECELRLSLRLGTPINIVCLHPSIWWLMIFIPTEHSASWTRYIVPHNSSSCSLTSSSILWFQYTFILSGTSPHNFINMSSMLAYIPSPECNLFIKFYLFTNIDYLQSVFKPIRPLVLNRYIQQVYQILLEGW